MAERYCWVMKHLSCGSEGLIPFPSPVGEGRFFRMKPSNSFFQISHRIIFLLKFIWLHWRPMLEEINTTKIEPHRGDIFQVLRNISLLPADLRASSPSLLWLEKGGSSE
jgi:hypothetical protein